MSFVVVCCSRAVVPGIVGLGASSVRGHLRTASCVYTHVKPTHGLGAHPDSGLAEPLRFAPGRFPRLTRPIDLQIPLSTARPTKYMGQNPRGCIYVRQVMTRQTPPGYLLLSTFKTQVSNHRSPLRWGRRWRQLHYAPASLVHWALCTTWRALCAYLYVVFGFTRDGTVWGLTVP